MPPSWVIAAVDEAGPSSTRRLEKIDRDGSRPRTHQPSTDLGVAPNGVKPLDKVLNHYLYLRAVVFTSQY